MIGGVTTLVGSGLGAWFLKSQREFRDRQKHHDDYECQERQRRIDLYVDSRELLCVACEHNFLGPVPIENDLPVGCPKCCHVDTIIVKMRETESQVSRPESHLAPPDPNFDVELYIRWRDEPSEYEQDKIRDKIISRIDSNFYSTLTLEQRVERTELVYRIWRSRGDTVSRDCILNLYDNNCRKRIQSERERNLLRTIVLDMAASSDNKVLRALANQNDTK